MRVAEYVHAQLRRRAELGPTGYPWSFIIVNESAMVLILIGSTLQRTRADLPAVAVAALLTVTPSLLYFVLGLKFHTALHWTMPWTATAVLLFATSTPIAGDVAPLLLVFMVGIVASLTAVVWGPVVFGSAAALLLAAAAAHRLDWVALYLGVVAMGWLMSYLIRTQQQLWLKQQEMQADLAEHAAADERRRIAGEVHDVIAHSLSITLLHVTGARRALQQDSDIDDAVGALVDAERLGRQAMADIRRTVGLLEAGPAKTAPEPGIADIPRLLDDFISTGLTVTLHSEGDCDQVSAAVGLALYRITQESLANIAKHAPSSKATVDVVITRSAAQLSIVNEMPVAVGATTADGRGVAGMRQRVELLGGVIDAGPCREGWSVRAEIPLTDPSPQPRSCLR